MLGPIESVQTGALGPALFGAGGFDAGVFLGRQRQHRAVAEGEGELDAVVGRELARGQVGGGACGMVAGG